MILITGAELLTYVKAPAPTVADQTRADEVAAAINAAVTRRLDWSDERVLAGPTPAELDELTEAALIAGAELWARRAATFGVTGYADVDGAAIRVGRDPLGAVAPMIDRHKDPSGAFG